MTSKTNQIPVSGKVKLLPLGSLHFDLSNPRYGPDVPTQKSDKEALDYIVSRFDMQDVLSSISVNGFFDSEPLVGIEEANEEIRILEGNRRLAACLILAGDSRASTHNKKRESYPLKQSVNLTNIPVMVYPKDTGAKHLLPYLGVRHIVGGKPWDSYAKAHWVAATLAAPNNQLSLSDIKAMLGDHSGLIERLLSAYHLVDQLKRAGKFDPKDTVKSGKGSASFPFSLIYNALDNGSFRKWLGLPDESKPNDKDPVPSKRLDDAATVVKMICGSKSTSFAPSFSDSRKLGSFVQAAQIPELFARLKSGAPLDEVEKEALNTFDRVLGDLSESMTLLADAQEALTKSPLDDNEASKLAPTAKKVIRLGKAVSQILDTQSSADEDE